MQTITSKLTRVLVATLLYAAAVTTISLQETQKVIAQASCSKWDVSGEWVFVHSNDISARFTLQQTGTELHGNASYSHWVEVPCITVGCDELVIVHASVDGAIKGDSFEMTVYWKDPNGAIGVYTGKIGPQGRIQGMCYDRMHPQAIASWYTDRTAKCLTGSTGTGIGTTSSPLTTAPPPFIGTFGKTPANYQPMWVYAIKNDGELLWYRKDTGEAPWQGPKSAGSDWANFKDVIPAGGNSVYALTDDGNLFWYQHNGFNDGARDWKARVNVGHGWTFSKIFSGGEGIIYAIKEDGSLLWYRHNGYADGGGPATWVGPKAVGSGWGDFKEVFSSGQGQVYAVKPDGTLLFYQQIGWETGERSWQSARQVGTGWADFRQIIPAGGGVILAITNDGRLLWYKHLGLKARNRYGRVKETWEGPIEIGSGWQGFKKVFAFIPVASAPIVR